MIEKTPDKVTIMPRYFLRSRKLLVNGYKQQNSYYCDPEVKEISDIMSNSITSIPHYIKHSLEYLKSELEE